MPNSQRYSSLEGLEPVKARMGGRGLPVPPLVPIVAGIALMAGISIGYGLAPRVQPVAVSPEPSATATPSPSPESLPSGYEISWVTAPGDASKVYVYVVDRGGSRLVPSATLPPRGVSLAVAAANQVEPVDLDEVVWARVQPYSMVNPLAPPNIWVWALDVRIASQTLCGGPSVLPTPASTPDQTGEPIATTVTCSFEVQTVVVDYKTGIWLETLAGSAP